MFERYAPIISLSVNLLDNFVYHDRVTSSANLLCTGIFFSTDDAHYGLVLSYVQVRTYDVVMIDLDIVALVLCQVAVVDEAHRLRNVKGKLKEYRKLILQRDTLQRVYWWHTTSLSYILTVFCCIPKLYQSFHTLQCCMKL